jgi:hypothetical protein
MPTRLTLADIHKVLARSPRTLPPMSETGCGPRGRFVRARWAIPVSRVVVDSRRCIQDSVFVALRGEQSDGHQYVCDAFGRGAICAIVDRLPGPSGFGPDAMSPSAVMVDLRSEPAEVYPELLPECARGATECAGLPDR